MKVHLALLVFFSTWFANLVAAAVAAAGLASAAAQAPAAASADYVIVGGGTAGCVLAAKLCTGLPDAKIVLLERAAPRSAEAEATVRAMHNFFNPVVGETPEVTESWESEPNPGLADRTVSVYSGTTLGGSSAVNGAQFSTPTNDVPAGWGVTGLDAATAGELYERVRTKMNVAQPPPALTTSYHAEYFEANAAVGVKVIEPPEVPDGADVDSVWTSYLLADEIGNRTDAYRGYLEPVIGSCTNLEVIETATVTKLLLDGNATATGVQYQTEQDGTPQEVSVSGEVILAAGPYHSPKLLQLSGIGPAAVLQSFEIPQVAELPVGESAQSRAYDNILSSYYGVELSAGGGYDDEAALAEQTELFNSGQPSKLGFTKAQINGIWASPLGIWRVMSWIFDIGEGNDPRVHQSGCIPNPESFATVSLRSTDPFDTPVVNTNLFGSPGEAETMVQCLEKEREVLAQMPANFNMSELPRFPETITPADVQETTVNGNHFVGTCGIGRVVGPDLKVMGFSNLRVVDASAIPEMPPNSGPLASVYLLAEHISDGIIADSTGTLPEQEQAPAPSSTAAPATPRAAPDPAAEPTTPGPGQASSSPAGTPVNPEEMAGEEAGEEAPDVQLSSTDVPGSAWSHTAPLALVLAAVALAVV